MANITVERLRSLPIKRTDEVWEVGLISVPVNVGSDGVRPVHPVMGVCASTSGGAMMSDAALPDELPSSALLDALASFALDPHVPGARPLGYLPGIVHTTPAGASEVKAHEHFAAALESLGVEVKIRSQLPIVTDFAAFMAEQALAYLGPPPSIPGLLRKKGMKTDRVRAFAEAAVEFYEAAPWNLSEGEALWSIQPARETRQLSHCCAMGKAGEQAGLAFFATPDDCLLLEVVQDVAAFLKGRRGTLWSVLFEPREELPETDAALWAEESLPVARPDAYPLALGLKSTGKIERPSTAQLTHMEAVLRAMARLKPAHVAQGAPTFTVETFEGTRNVTLELV